MFFVLEVEQPGIFVNLGHGRVHNMCFDRLSLLQIPHLWKEIDS